MQGQKLFGASGVTLTKGTGSAVVDKTASATPMLFPGGDVDTVMLGFELTGVSGASGNVVVRIQFDTGDGDWRNAAADYTLALASGAKLTDTTSWALLRVPCISKLRCYGASNADATYDVTGFNVTVKVVSLCH